MKNWLRVAFNTAGIIAGLFAVGFGINGLADSVFTITNEIHDEEA